MVAIEAFPPATSRSDLIGLVSRTFNSSDEHLGQRIDFVGFHIPHESVLAEI